MLRLAGAVEDASEHPIAQAIARAAARAGRHAPARCDEFANERGPRGPQARSSTGADGATSSVAPRLLADCGGARPGADATLEAAVAAATDRGQTAVVVGWDGRARGVLVVADAVKPTSAEAVARLRGLGLTPVLLTGDNEAVARAVAAEVGIDRTT